MRLAQPINHSDSGLCWHSHTLHSTTASPPSTTHSRQPQSRPPADKMSTANSPPPQLPKEYLPALDDCIGLALSLLRSDKGSAALSAVGRSTAQRLGLVLSETMEIHVKRFIEALTNDGCPTASFLPISLIEKVDAYDAAFIEKVKTYDAAFIPSPDAGHWPKGGFSGFGTMAINEIVGSPVYIFSAPGARYEGLCGQRANLGLDQNIRAMSPAVVAINQEKPDLYRRFLFNTGLALARELVHCFFYTMEARGASPVLRGDDIASVWEKKTFGHLLVSNGDHKRTHAWLCSHCWIDNNGRMQQIKLPANLEKCIPKSKKAQPQLPLTAQDSLVTLTHQHRVPTPPPDHQRRSWPIAGSCRRPCGRCWYIGSDGHSKEQHPRGAVRGKPGHHEPDGQDRGAGGKPTDCQGKYSHPADCQGKADQGTGGNGEGGSKRRRLRTSGEGEGGKGGGYGMTAA